MYIATPAFILDTHTTPAHMYISKKPYVFTIKMDLEAQVHKLSLLEAHPPFAWLAVNVDGVYQARGQFLTQLLNILPHLVWMIDRISLVSHDMYITFLFFFFHVYFTCLVSVCRGGIHGIQGKVRVAGDSKVGDGE